MKYPLGGGGTGTQNRRKYSKRLELGVEFKEKPLIQLTKKSTNKHTSIQRR
jgi:hypothetical protein